MSRRTVHNKDCELILGKEFNHVHAFLDQYASIFTPIPYLGYHRTFLHNNYGLAIVKEKWGTPAQVAAKLHLIRDYVYTFGFGLDAISLRDVIKLNNIENYCKLLIPFLDTFDMGDHEVPHIVAQTMHRKNIGLVAISMEVTT